jgi:hypothetical protein
MNASELLKAFLQVPELSTVGSAQERAAFIAIRLERRTVRETGEALGVSKSQVANLADLFQAKLATRMMELQKKGRAVSAEYLALERKLHYELGRLSEESGSDVWDWGAQIGHFRDCGLSREDLAECFGEPSPRFDDE